MMLGLARHRGGAEVPRDRLAVHRGRIACQQQWIRSSRCSYGSASALLRKLPGRLLQASERDPAPLRHKAQMRIAAEQSLMVELAQKVAHARMVLEIPGRQVRW